MLAIGGNDSYHLLLTFISTVSILFFLPTSILTILITSISLPSPCPCSSLLPNSAQPLTTSSGCIFSKMWLFHPTWSLHSIVHNYCSELLFSHSVVPDSLRHHGLQHARLPCPSPSPRACSNSCPSSQWWHPTILSSAIPFSSCLQSFPASGSFPMNLLFASGGQSIRASASVLPMNIQGCLPKKILFPST